MNTMCDVHRAWNIFKSEYIYKKKRWIFSVQLKVGAVFRAHALSWVILASIEMTFNRKKFWKWQFTKIGKQQRDNNKPLKEQGWRRLTWITNNKLEQYKTNYSQTVTVCIVPLKLFITKVLPLWHCAEWEMAIYFQERDAIYLLYWSRFHHCKKSKNHTCMVCIVESSFIAFKAGICTKKKKKDLTVTDIIMWGQLLAGTRPYIGHARTTDLSSNDFLMSHEAICYSNLSLRSVAAICAYSVSWPLWIQVWLKISACELEVMQFSGSPCIK